VSSNTTLLTPFSNNVNGGIIKIDHNFNKDNMLTGRYFLGDSEQSFPLALVGGGCSAKLQHLHAHARAAGVHFLCVHYGPLCRQ